MKILRTFFLRILVCIANMFLFVPMYFFLSAEKRKQIHFVSGIIVYGNFGGANYPYDAFGIIPSLKDFTDNYLVENKKRVPVDLLDACFKYHDDTCLFSDSKFESFKLSMRTINNVFDVVMIKNKHTRRFLYGYAGVLMMIEALESTPKYYLSQGLTVENRKDLLERFDKFCTAINVFSNGDITETEVLTLLAKEKLL